MLKDMKLPQALVVCVVFLGTLGSVYLFAKSGMDPTPAVVFGGMVFAGLGFGTVVAQQQQIKEQTNGASTAQLGAIRHLAAMVAVAQPTPQMTALAAQLAQGNDPAPVSTVPAISTEPPH